MSKFLVIAEKPSVAQSYAKNLSAYKREDGYLEGESCIVSWCLGHLAEYAQPEEYDPKYEKWQFDDLPIPVSYTHLDVYKRQVEIWKRFRKWGGIPTGITQNVKDLLASREIENIFENSDFILMLNQASGDRQILAKQLNISPHQLSYVTNSGEGEGLVFYGSTIIPFKDKFDNSLMLYALMTSKPDEVEKRKKLGIGERDD